MSKDKKSVIHNLQTQLQTNKKMFFLRIFLIFLCLGVLAFLSSTYIPEAIESRRLEKEREDLKLKLQAELLEKTEEVEVEETEEQYLDTELSLFINSADILTDTPWRPIEYEYIEKTIETPEYVVTGVTTIRDKWVVAKNRTLSFECEITEMDFLDPSSDPVCTIWVDTYEVGTGVRTNMSCNDERNCTVSVQMVFFEHPDIEKTYLFFGKRFFASRNSLEAYTITESGQPQLLFKHYPQEELQESTLTVHPINAGIDMAFVDSEKNYRIITLNKGPSIPYIYREWINDGELLLLDKVIVNENW
jgi:hypothetical protein